MSTSAMRKPFKRYRKYKKNYVPRNVKQYVQKQLDANIEDRMKTHSLVTYFASIGSATWTELSLCEPTQGDGLEHRTAVQIKIKSVEIKGVISTGASGNVLDDDFNVVRMVLGVYHGGTVSTATPLTDGGALIDMPIMAQYLSDGRLMKKYIDKFIPLGIQSTEKGGGDGYTPEVRLVEYYKRFKKPIHVYFGTTAGSSASKKLILSMISDSAAVPNPGFVNGFVKVMFEDA